MNREWFPFFLPVESVAVCPNQSQALSLVSYLLVIYENKKKESIFAGNLYFIMTHLGTAFIIGAFF